MKTFTWTHGGLLGALVALVLAGSATAQGLDTNTADLPPDGDYVSPDDYEYSILDIVLDDPVFRPLVATTVRQAIGDDEMETFDSTLDAVDIGLGLGRVRLTGPVQVRTRDRNLGTAGLFDAEIVSMSLSGNTGIGQILIREDPTRSSLGQMDITDIGGGLYHIDSFFDVFTELSVDGGSSWSPCTQPARMTLVPEPATLALVALGGLGVLTRRKRK